MNLSAVLITGLFAGGVSCAAVQGGLLTGLITRQRNARPEPATEFPGHADREGNCTGQNGVRTAARHTWSARLGDDLTPVGGFLAGKLASHTALGALLGALGATAQLSVSTRTWLQIGAGLLVIVFGLAQLRVPGFRRIVIAPPNSWAKLVNNRARSQTAVAPAVLGLTTVLIPCGVTLSVEALALASGSPLLGAATMAVFVAGTAPLFALLGYTARKAATAWRGRLSLATGLVVLVMGLFTLNGGLELAGSPLAASRLLRAGAEPTAPGDESVSAAGVSTEDGHQTVIITATSDGYTPDNLQVHAGLPTTLVVRSQHAQGCIRSFTVPSLDMDKILPTTGQTRIELGVLRPGQLDYACGMGMYTGTLTVN